MPLNWLPHFVNYLAASPIISSCIRRDPIITQLYLYLFNHKHCTNFIPCVYISSFCRFLGSNFFTPSNFHAVVLRMISFGCDYCWTIHSSHFDHKVQCSLMSFFFGHVSFAAWDLQCLKSYSVQLTFLFDWSAFWSSDHIGIQVRFQNNVCSWYYFLNSCHT